jgi:hypothetical protein
MHIWLRPRESWTARATDLRLPNDWQAVDLLLPCLQSHRLYWARTHVLGRAGAMTTSGNPCGKAADPSTDPIRQDFRA